MLYQKLFLVLGSIAIGSNVAHAVGSSCSKYLVESAGKDLSFNSYLFQDFRGLAGASAGPSPKPTNSDSNNGASTGAYEAPIKSLDKRDTAMQSYFQSANITRTWVLSSWNRMTSPVPMKNVPANVFIDYDPTTPNNQDTMLSIITSRGANGVQVVGELQSVFNINYGSIRFESRVTGSPGACAGMFLYHSDTSESDFEFLTQEGTRHVHLTNQPGNKNGLPVPGATTNLSLSVPYSQWNTYRLDWSPGMTRYFINGEIVVNKTVNVSPFAMHWMMNIWSDGTSWPGVMPIGGSARLDVRWLEIVYNNPNALPADGNKVCRVQAGTNVATVGG